MHIVLSILAVVLILGGFVGLGLGVIPTIVAWLLAAFCIMGAWRLRPEAQRRRERRLSQHPTA